MPETILVVDDEPTQRFLAEHITRDKLGYNVVTLDGGREAIDYVRAHRTPAPDLMLLDLAMPEVSGMDVIHAVRNVRPSLPIIVLTVHSDLARAVAAIKAGANDFLAKPVPTERLRLSVQNVLQMRRLNEEVVRLQRGASGQTGFSDIIGTSAALKTAISLAQRSAASDIPVMIEGESGVGKELFARAIHGSSDRMGKPFVSVNCGAIPDSMAESILFGHEKDAFPGALYQALGKFREAEGGTLFLDEIGELKPDVQAKLLRVLQENQIMPLGARASVHVDTRIISATSRDLLQRVREGQFREDLYYRLNVFPLYVPSLRHRKEDIPLLAHHFLLRFSALEHKNVDGISGSAMEYLTHHPWPGNIRQMENAVFRAVVLCTNTLLEPADFQQNFLSLGAGRGMNTPAITGEYNTLPASEQLLAMMKADGNVKRILEVEGELIQFALKYYGGRMSEVAKRLGIGRSTLYRKIQDFGLLTPATH